MADITLRTTANVPGTFYVDNTCTDCDLCRNIAPAVFGRNAQNGLSFVQHQPQTPEELALATEAAESCPFESIGSDGK